MTEVIEREKRASAAAAETAAFFARLRVSHELNDDELAAVFHSAIGRGPRGPPLLKDWISDAELAAELNVGVHTLRGWRRRKIGPPFAKHGKQIRYRVGEVQSWLKSLEQQQPARSRRNAAERRPSP
jgi:hypothetical protein